MCCGHHCPQQALRRNNKTQRSKSLRPRKEYSVLAGALYQGNTRSPHKSLKPGLISTYTSPNHTFMTKESFFIENIFSIDAFFASTTTFQSDILSVIAACLIIVSVQRRQKKRMFPYLFIFFTQVDF